MAILKERWSINISYIYEKNLENKYIWRHFLGSQYSLNEMKHFGTPHDRLNTPIKCYKRIGCI